MGSESLYEILPVSVQSFLKSNPPVQIWDDSERPKLTAPLIFHERHLDALLTLKKVEIIPLERFLSFALDLTLKSVTERRVELPTIGQLGVFDDQKDQELYESSVLPMNANCVAQVYEKNASLYSCYLASTLLFHPQASQWSGVCFDWRAMDLSEHHLSAALNCYGLNIESPEFLTQNEKDAMDNDTLELIDTLHRRRRPLAWWQIFFTDKEAKSLLTDMERIALTGAFNAGCCNTYGYRPPPPCTFPLSIDAPTTPWGTPVSSLCTGPTDPVITMVQDKHKTRETDRVLRKRDKQPRYVQQERKTPKSSSKRDKNPSLWPKVRLPDRPANSMIDLFLLRVRLLNLQAGLYVSIVQDAVNRMQNENKNTKSKSRKRQRGSDGEEPSRKYKTRYMVSKERADAEERDRDYEVVKSHVSERSLALVELRFGQYNSSAPAAFIRSGTMKKKTYNSDEYLSLVLTSKLGYGATGAVYDARLEVLVDGCPRRARVVVKLGFKGKEIKSMRYEYSIYQQLSSHDVVEGIPYIFGLYEDVESDTVALVMSYVGNCLWQLRPDKTKGYVRVSEVVEETYIKILKNIHQAGIRHGDIGEQNLMLTDDGRITIIDFDRAEKYPSQDQKEAEVQELIALFRVKSPAPRTEPVEDISTRRDLLDDLIAEIEAEDSLNGQDEDIVSVPS
ncbi:hypothetical protein C0993_005273 [Termitomyces sp. T159_Od127]|nr:hypothetical protein C0993_005273 [Termitomyces sp. T159_Od127]